MPLSAPKELGPSAAALAAPPAKAEVHIQEAQPSQMSTTSVQSTSQSVPADATEAKLQSMQSEITQLRDQQAQVGTQLNGIMGMLQQLVQDRGAVACNG